MNISTPVIPLSAPAEKQLAEKACRGDVQAFGELYDRYAPVLLGLITQLTRDGQKAEEVLQETFVRGWKELQTPGSRAEGLFTQLLIIARGLAGGAVNKQEIKNNQGSGNLKAIDLVYFKGYGFSEAAVELNLTVSELKTRIRTEMNTYRGITTR